jgi:hypothetical protein
MSIADFIYRNTRIDPAGARAALGGKTDPLQQQYGQLSALTGLDPAMIQALFTYSPDNLDAKIDQALFPDTSPNAGGYDGGGGGGGGYDTALASLMQGAGEFNQTMDFNRMSSIAGSPNDIRGGTT